MADTDATIPPVEAVPCRITHLTRHHYFLVLGCLVVAVTSCLMYDESLVLSSTDFRGSAKLHISSFDKNYRDMDAIQLSELYVEPPSNITTAICFKNLYHDIDLGVVLQWAAYHRLLGIDHIFMWYRPEVSKLPRFEELCNLSYVTLTDGSSFGGNQKNYYGQKAIHDVCLQDDKYAKNFDWVLLSDNDEYLWFNEQIGLKEFLKQHEHLSYLSFGKWMYTLDHSTETSGENVKIDMTGKDFQLNKYPFYLKYFCWPYHPRQSPPRGHPVCPVWWGRAKVIVRPKVHPHIGTHGMIRHPDLGKGQLHFDSDTAHMKEWPFIFDAHHVTKRTDRAAFEISKPEHVHVHNLREGFRPNEHGNYTVHYDDNLGEWFDFVKRRAFAHRPSSFKHRRERHRGT